MYKVRAETQSPERDLSRDPGLPKRRESCRFARSVVHPDRADCGSLQNLSRVRGRGALSLRLRAQTLSRTGRGWLARPAWNRAEADAALPVQGGQALGNSTSPGPGEVASLSEPERALSRTGSGVMGNLLIRVGGASRPSAGAAEQRQDQAGDV